MKDIKEQRQSVALKLEEGHRESMIQFNARKGGPSKPLTTIIVVVALSSIATLQHQDVKSPSARTVCDDLVRSGIRQQQQQYVILSESESPSAPTQKSFAPVPVAVDIPDGQCHILDGKQRFIQPNKKLQEKAKWTVVRIVQEASKVGGILGGKGRRDEEEV